MFIKEAINKINKLQLYKKAINNLIYSYRQRKAFKKNYKIEKMIKYKVYKKKFSTKR